MRRSRKWLGKGIALGALLVPMFFLQHGHSPVQQKQVAELPAALAATPAQVNVASRPVALAPRPTAAELSSDVVDDSPQQRAARAASLYIQARSSIFNSEVETLQDLLARNDALVTDLTALLMTPPAISNVQNRMAAIDLLEDLAANDVAHDVAADAQTSLSALALRELPSSLDAAGKVTMVGEKYDALAALTRIDPQRAFETFRQLGNTRRKAALETALMTGLVDRGVPRSRVAEEFNSYLSNQSNSTTWR